VYADVSGRVRYLHQAGDADHLVVPVESGELRWLPRCDFCSADDVKWTIYCDTFIIPSCEVAEVFNLASDPGVGHVLSGNWAACDTCIDLVRRQRWTALTTRVRNTCGPDPSGRLLNRNMLLRVYAQLAIHMRGIVPREP